MNIKGQTKLYQWSANFAAVIIIYKHRPIDLIDKIGTGYYKENNYLPPEAELAKLPYGVSVATIRSALKVLNELGFAGKRWMWRELKVILQDTADTYRCMRITRIAVILCFIWAVCSSWQSWLNRRPDCMGSDWREDKGALSQQVKQGESDTLGFD